MYHPFSVAETVKTAWKIFTKNFITIMVYSFASTFLLLILGAVVEFVIAPEDFAVKMLVTLAIVLIQAYTTLGLYKLIFTVIDSEYYEFEFNQVLPAFKSIISYLVVVFIIAFVVTTFNFAIVRINEYPNIQELLEDIAELIALFVALRVMFFITFIVDDQSGAFESIRQSLQLTKGYFLKVVTIMAIILLLIYLPAKISQYYSFVSVAIIFTYPFVNIILAVTYRKLVYSHQDVDDDIAETN